MTAEIHREEKRRVEKSREIYIVVQARPHIQILKSKKSHILKRLKKPISLKKQRKLKQILKP